MCLPLPLDAGLVVVAIDMGSRITPRIDAEVLNVDLVFGQIEIWLVLTMIGGRGIEFVRLFVLEFNPHHDQPIGNDHFLQRFLRNAIETHDPVRSDPLSIFTFSPEVPNLPRLDAVIR